MSSPKKSFTCEERMITAIPEVKPSTKVCGKNFNRLPKRRSPMATISTPAMSVAMVSPSTPYFCTML